MSINSDLIAEIRPALREFEASLVEGRDSLCLTLEVDDNRRVWVQLVSDTANIGLLDDEDSARVIEMLKKHKLEFSEDDYQSGEYFTINLVSKRDERFVLFLHDVLSRHQSGDECFLNVKSEDL